MITLIKEDQDKVHVKCEKCSSSWSCHKIYHEKFSFCYTCMRASIPKKYTYSLDEIRIIGYIKNNFIAKEEISIFRDVTNKPEKIFTIGNEYKKEGFTTPQYYIPDGLTKCDYTWSEELHRFVNVKISKGTCFEILGDFYHSNPEFYESDKPSPRKNLTNGQNYQYTKDRLDHLKELGYTIIFIWISDFNKFCKGKLEFHDILNKSKEYTKIQRSDL